MLTKLWPNRRVFVLGGGPSLLNEDLNLLNDERVLAVNNAYKFPQADAVYFKDCTWYLGKPNVWFEGHEEDLKSFNGPIFTTCKRVKGDPAVTWVEKGPSSGICTQENMVVKSTNAGHEALNVAYHLGASSVVLIGYDMQPVDNERNWHRDHPEDADAEYWKFYRDVKGGVETLDGLGIPVYNTSPYSDLGIPAKLEDLVA